MNNQLKNGVFNLFYFFFLEEEMGLYCMLAYTNIRVIVLNQLQKRSIKRLRTLNPQPEFYAIAANTENMNNLFEIVNIIN